MDRLLAVFKSIEKNKAPEIKSGAPQKIIAFLGNPGAEYAFTRHNAGFMLAEYFAEKNSLSFDRLKFSALTAETVIAEKKVLLLKPQTYMNKSGEAVRDALSFFKLSAESSLIVVYDDIYLDVGMLRIRKKGSDGGHNGIKNIIYHTGTDCFERIRIGVGKPPSKDAMVNWVLGKIPETDKQLFSDSLVRAGEALPLMIAGKTDEAMNKYSK